MLLFAGNKKALRKRGFSECLMRQKRVLIQQKRQPKAIKERLALHLFIVGQAVKRHINSDGSCAF